MERGFIERRRARDERDEPRGYVEGPGRGGQWQYRDLDYREPQWTSPPQRYVGPSWTREAGYGREGTRPGPFGPGRRPSHLL